MAIAPSRLGEFVSGEWHSDEAVATALRREGLVRRRVSDEDLVSVVRRAREEHLSIPSDLRAFNSPHERVRVFLASFLSFKGRRWAVPLRSLEPWWRLWG